MREAAPRYLIFEVVRSDAGWFGRAIARNGREVWRTSEVYVRRAGVVRAIGVITAAMPSKIRDVDERTQP